MMKMLLYIENSTILKRRLYYTFLYEKTVWENQFTNLSFYQIVCANLANLAHTIY